MAITSVECTSKTVYNCINSLKLLIQRGTKVTLHWVRAHVGHELNEEVDRLAKFGTTSNWQYRVPVSWSYIKTELKNVSLRSWYKRWKRESTCRQTRLILPCYYHRLSKMLWSLDRYSLSRMVQFITGHNYLLYHLKNVSKSNTNVCRSCDSAPETAWHLLTECPALEVDRMMQFFEAESLSLPDPERLKSMVLYTVIGARLGYPGTLS